MAAQLNSMQKRVLIQKKRRTCFICDGTGEMCNICGESAAVCKCKEEDRGPCENCEGEGSVEVTEETR